VKCYLIINIDDDYNNDYIGVLIIGDIYLDIVDMIL